MWCAPLVLGRWLSQLAGLSRGHMAQAPDVQCRSYLPSTSRNSFTFRKCGYSLSLLLQHAHELLHPDVPSRLTYENR
jgi:hypothetical protein